MCFQRSSVLLAEADDPITRPSPPSSRPCDGYSSRRISTTPFLVVAEQMPKPSTTSSLSRSLLFKSGKQRPRCDADRLGSCISSMLNGRFLGKMELNATVSRPPSHSSKCSGEENRKCNASYESAAADLVSVALSTLWIRLPLLALCADLLISLPTIPNLFALSAD